MSIKRTLKLALLLFLTTIISSCISSPPPPPPQGDCMNSLLSMLPCMDFITDRNSSLPAACCPRLAGVVQTRPLCLCHVLNGDVSAQIGRPVDKERALALPEVCRVHTPSENECKTSCIPPLFPASPPNASSTVSPPSGLYGPPPAPATPPAPVVVSSNGSRAQWKLSLFVVYSIIYLVLLI